jgi:zinc protease
MLFLLAWAHAAEPSIDHVAYTLDNGLRVILAEDHSVPFVWTDVWYEVGSKDEKPGRTGFAHLFEHLMFQGSERYNDDYFKPLQRVGGTINGNTTVDRTNYFEGVPSHHLPLALFMESDRMARLLPVLDQKKLDNQREVVRNERRQNYENRPYGESWPLILENIFPVGHPYHTATIGKHEDLEAATLADVKDFFQTWYVPNNAILVVAGDFQADEARRLIQENFGGIPRGTLPERVTPEPVRLTAEKKVKATDRVPVDRVWIVWPSPKVLAPGDAELDLLANLLTGGLDAPLTRALVHEKRIAQSISAQQSSMRHQSVFVISATAAEGHTGEELVAEIDRVLAEVQKKGIAEADLAVGRTAYEVNFWSSLQTISGKASSLASYAGLTGDPGYATTDLQRYTLATTESVQSAMKNTLVPGRLVLTIGPEPQ